MFVNYFVKAIKISGLHQKPFQTLFAAHPSTTLIIHVKKNKKTFALNTVTGIELHTVKSIGIYISIHTVTGLTVKRCKEL